ncbi:MAG TPA: retropepsin-like aspartic protease [Solirubrobacteraceae bacterium]|nr:retropepsin-like aspartic protease [Solirubrobacteraceae bacterium]
MRASLRRRGPIVRRSGLIAVLALAAAIVPAAGTGAQGAGAPAAIQVPIDVLSGPNGQKLLIAPVTINGKQYPFVLDTGASGSAISLGLATALHLPKAGRAHRAVSAGCTPKSQPITISTWSLGTASLPAHRLDATKLGLHAVGAVGLLGSDVLSTFDKVSIDYAHKVLTLRG